MNPRFRRIVAIACLVFPTGMPAQDQRERFLAEETGLEVWRLTFDPTARDWANYHNTRCFSPDGRYVCFSRYRGSGGKSDSSIHVHDLHENRSREIGPGVFPRWARHHNWLIYARYNVAKRRKDTLGVETVLLDLGSNQEVILADDPGCETIGETTHDDRWLIAASRHRGEEPEFRNVRISLPDGEIIEPLPDVFGAQRMTNPRHPVFFTRRDHRADPFAGTRLLFDLEGRLLGIGAPTLQKCHMSWSGDGEYLLLGNGLIRGRRWNEPFPSNVEILARVSVGDISPCGDSGRWICGDSTLADLRSGDGRPTVEPLSMIAFPASIGDNSGIYDADPKGSPDGTKICFVTNYPINEGPVSPITEVDRDSIGVESTAGFPDRGRLLVRREVIGYRRKTDTAFEGLSRKLHDTMGDRLAPGRIVTSFEARCLSDEDFAGLESINTGLLRSLPKNEGRSSPLARQRMTDVYAVVVRKPDRPHLRLTGGVVELIPGENHREIRAYRLLRDGTPVGEGGELPDSLLPGTYTAIAIEWSGLQSEDSLPLPVDSAAGLRVRDEKPADFQWTGSTVRDRIRETVHRHDGVIRREWLDPSGRVIRRHDLNGEGKAIRRVEFDGARITGREYYDPDNRLVSREVFDPDGFVTEQMHFTEGPNGRAVIRAHWFYERGMPVRHIHGTGGRVYEKQGDRWGRIAENGNFIDLPRGSNSE